MNSGMSEFYWPLNLDKFKNLRNEFNSKYFNLINSLPDERKDLLLCIHGQLLNEFSSVVSNLILIKCKKQISYKSLIFAKSSRIIDNLINKKKNYPTIIYTLKNGLKETQIKRQLRYFKSLFLKKFSNSYILKSLDLNKNVALS